MKIDWYFQSLAVTAFALFLLLTDVTATAYATRIPPWGGIVAQGPGNGLSFQVPQPAPPLLLTPAITETGEVLPDTPPDPGEDPGKEITRFIVMLKNPPLAVQLEVMQQDQTLTLTQREAEEKSYTAQLTAEQTTFSDKLQRMGLIQQVERRFTYLVNGVVVTARLEDREAIARLPEVQRVYFDYQASIHLAESVPLIGAPTVWNMLDKSGKQVTGKGVKVGIIDTGIDYTHPDLGGCLGHGCKVAGGFDFVNYDNDPQDDHKHGTHVAGIVGANGMVKGVAPDVTLFAYKACDAGGTCYQSNVIAALERAATDGVDIVNMSLGGPGSPDDPMATAANQATAQGILVVASAGNKHDYWTMESPGVAARVLTVGATYKDGSLAYLTSKGPVEGYILKPDLVAPGISIYSTGLNHGYIYLGGTSMAAPHTAGAAALLKQLHPDWRPGMLKSSLMNSARLLGSDPFSEGAGRLRVDAAAWTRVVIQPGSLSLGRMDRSKPTWTTTAPLKINNVSDARRTYQLAIDANLPSSISARLSQTSVTLASGQSQEVNLTITANTAQLIYPYAQPHVYSGRVVVTNEGQPRHVIFAFAPPPLSCQEQTQVPLAECEALETVYNNVNGPNWWSKRGWLDVPPCSWSGITCTEDHVTRVYLPQNNLWGEIPCALDKLTKLEGLWMALNTLQGTIPPCLANLASLKDLSLGTNRLTGPIPPELGHLSNLTMFAAQNNQLTGSIPPELAELKKLEWLYLADNQLSGTIPSGLGSLSNLQRLYLSNNDLSGSIPRELGNITSLDLLYLDGNNLSGNIPAELSRATQLRLLWFGGNHLSGNIPAELARLPNLTWLSLARNQLSGRLPPELGTLPNLIWLELDNNALAGEVPLTFTRLTSLTITYLGYNKLTASDPAVATFLDSKDPDWAQTQTIPPANIEAALSATQTVRLTWSPIPYVADGGYYQISYATQPSGPFSVHGITGSKSDTSYIAANLSPSPAYYFIVQSFTPAHGGDQQNDLWSEPSREIFINVSPAPDSLRLFLPVIVKAFNS